MNLSAHQFPKGTKVTYTPTGDKGVVKSHAANEGWVHVVYDCAHDWRNYEKYTGCATHVNQLKKGWNDAS